MEQLRQEERELVARAVALPAAVQELDAALQSLSLPERPTDESMSADVGKALAVYRAGEVLLAACPPKPARDEIQAKGAEIVKGTLRRVRNSFARSYAGAASDGWRLPNRSLSAAHLVHHMINDLAMLVLRTDRMASAS